ncbi:ABC transporter substrate-binding protein [Cohnella fermenti]|uniref:ABC transporter substrate-binding protein n=2 Tax=Cohnella fermenti TaxID=2565925 RepID=A0A4S4BKV5_9BACL|nr:ABC transporter substrate-binding protein [Cohnella fermenti]
MFSVLAVILILAIALVGCGNNGNNGNAESASPAASPSAAAASDESAAATASASASAESGTRTVEDGFGTVEIPVHPERVAGIYLEDYMLALGVAPVVQWYHPSWGKQDYLGLDDVPTFDITGEMEALIAYDLDLIIVDPGINEAQYEMYSKIAPTYRIPDSMRGDAVQTLKAVADVLGIPDKADAVLAAYDAKVADAKSRLQAAVGDQTVAVVRLDVGDKPDLRLFSDTNAYTGMLFKDLGLTPHPWSVGIDGHEAISQEKIPEFDVEHMIIFPSNGTWTSKENQSAIELLDSPLWKNVPAVKNGHVYRVERSHWQSGAITANSMKIDDLLKLFGA